MGIIKVEVDSAAICTFFVHQGNSFRNIKGLPEGVILRDVVWFPPDARGVFVFEHEDFPDVPLADTPYLSGEDLPQWEAFEISRIEDQPEEEEPLIQLTDARGVNKR
jgi:hypothetical protein